MNPDSGQTKARLNHLGCRASSYTNKLTLDGLGFVMQGLNVETLRNDLGNKFSRDQIKGAVEFLVNEGHLYSTIDDNHFKSTSC